MSTLEDFFNRHKAYSPEERRRAIQEMMDSYTSLHNGFKEKERIISQLYSEKLNLDNQITELKNKLDESEKLKEKLSKENRSRTSEADKAKHQLKLANIELTEANQKFMLIEVELHKSSAINQSYRKQIQDLRASLNTFSSASRLPDIIQRPRVSPFMCNACDRSIDCCVCGD